MATTLATQTRIVCFRRRGTLAYHRNFSATPPRHDELAGTAPSHTSYLLLNTQTPPPSFPSKIPSKLIRTLQLYTGQFGGLVNLAWSPPQVAGPLPSERDTSGPAEWDPGHAGGERYSALAFSAHRHFEPLVIPEVSMQNLNDVVASLREHALPEVDELGHPRRGSVVSGLRPSPSIHLYVCTHGERDCRCGETGGAVFTALCEEVERRGLSDTVRVGGVGHVGGHKYAANVIVFPFGEWLGRVTPATVPTVLDSILDLHNARSSFDALSTSPLCPLFWRGRMGLNKEEQLQLKNGARVTSEEPGLRPSRR